ncbi:MAG TPA: hypothetical protein VII99_17195 [Bacteroidia bacterium]
MKKESCLLICGLLITTLSFAQNDTALINRTITEDSTGINALALYPQNVRNAILEVCAHPDALTRMEAMQQTTKEKFKKILVEFDKDEQQKIWDITRYPGLVDSLASGGKKSKEEITTLLANYPPEIHETALQYGRTHYDVLKQIHSLNKKSQSDFDQFLKDYPPQTQASLKDIVYYPEVISILINNMHTTVAVGDIYKRNPSLVKQKLDSLNLALAQQNAKDLAEWKNGLEKNPDAKKEYEASAKEYAKKQGYNEEDLTVNDPKVIVNYVCYPYPYWYGYPWWWDYPHWYPYPYWYDWGFYYGPTGMVYIGFPSWYFTHWYFFNHPHHYYYSHFSDYCVGYYYGHRGSTAGVHRGVSEWVNKNESTLPRNFLANDSKRPDRLKEFGKFEMEYNKSGKNNSRDDYLKANASAYPDISPVLHEKNRTVEPQIPVRQKPTFQFPSQPHPYPPVRFPKPSFPSPLPNPQPKNIPFPQKTPLPSKGRRFGENVSEDKPLVMKDGFIRINEAECYHKYCWSPK